MVTRNVVLTDTQSDLVDRLVASGRYQNASEALRAGLRLLEREEAESGDLRVEVPDRRLADREMFGAGVFVEPQIVVEGGVSRRVVVRKVLAEEVGFLRLGHEHRRVFAQVLEGGTVRVGDRVDWE